MALDREGRPPDGGWGWVVIAGCFVILMTLSMMSYGFSILFSDFLLSHGASSTTIAWTFNLHFFLYNAIGVFSGPLTDEFGVRPVCLAGCGLAALCTFAIAFVDSLWGLGIFFATIGMFAGLGAKPCYLLLVSYFDRKRGRANAILMSGVCFSQFIGPPLIRHLLGEYGREGATLMLCGIVLQGVVGASLFQPVEWHMKVDTEKVTTEDKVEKEMTDRGDVDVGVTDEMRTKEAERLKMLPVRLSRRLSERSVLSMAVSNIDLSSIPPLSRRASCSSENIPDDIIQDRTDGLSLRRLPGFLRASANVMKAMVSNMKIVRYKRALILLLGGMLTVSSYLNFLMTVPFAIQGAGHSLSDAAWCMSIAAGTNLAARFTFSGLSDQPWFNLRYTYMAGVSIFSLCSAVFGFLQSLTLMQVAMAVWGFGVGMNMAVIILVMPHFMGAERMAAIFSVNSFALSISSVIFGPFFGFIRDASDSYVASMLAIGCCGALSVLLWCFMPAAVAYDERREAEERRLAENEEPPQKV